MSEQYTPTTGEIADWWAHKGGSTLSPYYASRLTKRMAEFDAWLAEHDRQVAERAWGAGYFVGLDREGYHGPDLNPHRASKGDQK